MFLVPTGIITALIAREDDRARPARAHVAVPGRAALHDADLAARRAGDRATSTSTMAQDVPARRAPGDDLRGRRQRVRALVDHERAHAGRRRQDAILGLADPPDPETFMTLLARGARRSSRRSAATTYKQREARRAHRRVPREQPRDRGDRVDGGTRSARAASRTRSSSRTTWSRRSTIPCSGTRRRSACRSTCSARRARSRARSRRPASTTTRSSASSATRRPRSRTFSGGGVMHALEGVRADRLRPVPRGPVRADDHRRPRRRRDQGRAGHRRRHAHGEQAVLRLPARQARHRARPQGPARPRDRARARRARRHRAPQHDRRRRDAARHRLRRLQAR